MEANNKQKISRETELAVRGLLQLAKSRMNDLRQYEAEIAALLLVPSEIEGYYGHVSDVVYGAEAETAETLFHKLNIECDKKALFGIKSKNRQ